MTAYRDELEAALQRADDLDREVAALRERNQRLETQLGSGETTEATANARRLAAALVREQEEQRLREQADLDERAARECAKAGRHLSHRASPAERRMAMVIYGAGAVIKIVVALLSIVAALAMRGHR